LSLIGVYLLSDFKLATCDEVESINFGDALSVDFLTSDELLRLHILKHLLDDVGTQGREDAEASEERHYLLELAFLLLADRPNVILPVESGESCQF